MAIEFFDAESDAGGLIGQSVGSGVKGAILPKVGSVDRTVGITIHRKFYIGSDEAISIKVGLNGYGLFSATVFESASDAEVVGDLIGTEDKYGASKIVKLEDSTTATEIVNGAGGLIDILKVTVEVDPTGDVYYRAGDTFNIDANAYTIASVALVAEGHEITLTANAGYFQAIGKYGASAITSSITAIGTTPFWLKITVQPNTITDLEYSSFSITTVF